MATNPFSSSPLVSPQAYKSLADIELENAQAGMQKLQLSTAVKKRQQEEVFKAVVAKHTKAVPGAAPVTDNNAVLTDLYMVDPELGQAYEDDIMAKGVARANAAAAEEKRSRDRAEYGTKRVLEELASIDTKSPSAPQMYAGAVQRLKAEGIPIDPRHEAYDPEFVNYIRDRAIGPEKKFSAETQLDLSKQQGANALATANVNADRARDVARITGGASIEKARIGAEAGVTKAQIGATSKSDGNMALGGHNPFAGRFQVTSGPGERKAPTAGASTNHQGTDYATPVGTPVPAMTGGTVVEAGPKGGYGNWVRIKFDDGSEQGYGHLSTVNVKPGQRVAPGQVVALTGNTGRSTGPHVHVRNYGAPVAAGAKNAPATAEAVLKYNGDSKLTKGGAIDLRTHPEMKTYNSLNIDKSINALGNAEQVLRAGGSTGPGTGLRNTADRLASGLRNVTGLSVGDAIAQEARVNAYDIVEAISTSEAIAALAGIGGNDTDRDFERARATTVGNLRNKNYNLSTIETARALYQMQKARVSFIQRWANQAGSPNATINGVTMNEAWDAYAKPKMKQIGQFAKQNGLVGNGKKSAPAPTPPKPANAVRRVRNRQGQQFWQMSDGSLKAIK